ncbi:MAG: hypothetical protein IJS08_07495 [Victivallales bacterium]|nr:hypothetical protein [Victivallales bacterium]
MAQITLAQALKEKNRLTGEIRRLWGLFQHENSCLTDHTRSIDVEKTLQTIEHYTAKLVELKTKIGLANAGNLQNMYRLEEAKNRMAKLNETNGSEDSDREYVRNEGYVYLKRTAVFNEERLLEMKRKLQMECNSLQDKLDAYNAMHKIEFDTPLVD